MNLAEPPDQSTNAADRLLHQAVSFSPCPLPPAASGFWVSVVDSFNLRLLLCADL